MRSPAFVLVLLLLPGCVVSADPGHSDSAGEDDTGATVDSTADTGRSDSITPDTSSGDVDADSGDSGCSKGGYPVCNPLNNCGCTGSKGKCDWTFVARDGWGRCASGGLSCVAPGAKGNGATCYFSFDCEAGLACLAGYCRRKCATATDCGTGSWQCAYIPGCAEDAGASDGASVCANKCQLSDPYACGFSGDGCISIGFFATCAKMGTKGAGETCAKDTDCKPGHGCFEPVGAPGTGLCFRLCRTGAPDCTSPQTCKSFSPAYSLDGTTYGYCG